MLTRVIKFFDASWYSKFLIHIFAILDLLEEILCLLLEVNVSCKHIHREFKLLWTHQKVLEKVLPKDFPSFFVLGHTRANGEETLHTSFDFNQSLWDVFSFRIELSCRA